MTETAVIMQVFVFR